MSEKKRRDITLGEMQDECKKHRHGECNNCTKCDPVIKKICDDLDLKSPYGLDLSDPPRFNEAQMALLNGFMAIGAVSVQEVSGWFAALDKDGKQINIARTLNLCGETLGLAELLGKDGADDAKV